MTVRSRSKENGMSARKPAIRVDGGRRTVLDKEHVVRRMAGIANGIPSTEEIAKAKASRQQEGIRSRRAAKKLARQDGGKDDARTVNVKVKISGMRTERKTMRCRPGTFEWRYGRNRQDAYFHAGNHFAILWERAGIALPSSAEFLRGIKSGYAAGVSNGKIAAIDSLFGIVEKIGHSGFERLMAYCVHGKTAAEIAVVEMQTQRDIATILHNDLRQCAVHFKFLGVNKRHSGGETT